MMEPQFIDLYRIQRDFQRAKLKNLATGSLWLQLRGQDMDPGMTV